MTAEQAKEAPACLHPIPAGTPYDPRRTERCEGCVSCRRHHETIVAAVEGAVAHCKARELGQPTLADVYELVPEWLRPYFGLPQGEGLKRLLGRWEKRTGRFVPGEVPEQWRLSQEEATVYHWELRGWLDWEMQRELTPKGLRGDRQRWVDIAEVHERLLSASAKVRGLFGLGPLGAESLII